MPEVIEDWMARRSGASMSIRGKDRHGREISLTQVERIVLDPEGPFARCADGSTHRLAMALPEE